MALTEEEVAKAKRYMPTELSTNSRVDVWLEIAELQADRNFFGEQYCYAISLLASHTGTLETRGGGDEVGSLSSKSEGSISISYSAGGSGNINGDLAQTIYGQKYNSLCESLRPAPMLTCGFGFMGF